MSTAAEFTFSPLTPVSFLERSRRVYSDRVAVIDGDRMFTYAEFGERCSRLAGGLLAAGVHAGDRVAVLASNSHEMLELHHAVPRIGGVLVPLNVRLSRPELVHIVQHSGARTIVATAEYAATASEVAEGLGIDCLVSDGPTSPYARLAKESDETELAVRDERSLLAINYTSGTTGDPKGVMCHHRGAYLQSLAMAFHNGLEESSTYLWTLPMFHCNGWCFPWAATAAGATHLCLRGVDADRIWQHIGSGQVTHFSAAPTVLSMISEAARRSPLRSPVSVAVTTGGSPPAPALLADLEKLNLRVTHLYGLTETFGPIGINQWNPAWDACSASERSALQARQGVENLVAQPVRVLDSQGHDVEADGHSLGEIAVRGNDVMLGYYNDESATAAATLAGHFRTGDLAVMHPDGYVEIRDRAKDVIISGGENISSIEVEKAVAEHPDVLECAVVARPDEKWGEVPVAFVTLRSGSTVNLGDLRDFVRQRLAGFKVPQEFVEAKIPKTSTGKMQKHLLRATVVDRRPDTRPG